MKTLLHSSCLLLLPLFTFAQSLKVYEKDGMDAFQKGDYYTARANFQIVADGSPKRAEAWYYYGEACRMAYDVRAALAAYQKVLELGETKRFPMTEFHLGDMLKAESKEEEAIQHFKSFLAMTEHEPTPPTEQGQLLGRCQQRAKAEILYFENKYDHRFWSPDSISAPELVKDKDVNSEYSDFAAQELDGQLYFSSRRIALNEPETELSGLFQNKNNRVTASPLNKKDLHTGNACTSADGQRMYFTICQTDGERVYPCALYVTRRIRSGWDKATKLPSPVNLAKYTQTQPSVGYDSVAQEERLYFVSDRPKGQGGMDIWYCPILDKGATYGEPVNLGAPVNTPGFEMTPFFHNTEQILYLSSDWHVGMGGYDVFASKRTPNGWEEPLNFQEVNSNRHDLYFNISPNEQGGYLSTNRQKVAGKLAYDCCLDIYHFDIHKKIYTPRPPVLPQEPPLVEVPPIVYIPDIVAVDTPPAPKVPRKPRLDILLPINLYFANDEPDSNTVSTTTLVTYSEAYESFSKLVPLYKKGYAEGRPPAAQEYTSKRVETFFRDTVEAQYKHLHEFSAQLLDHLQGGETIEVSLRGFTSPRANSTYNDALAARRIKSVLNEFQAWERDALLPYIQSGKLKFKLLPLGETQAPKGISDDLKDLKNSVYSIEASKERRVDIERVTVY